MRDMVLLLTHDGDDDNDDNDKRKVRISRCAREA